ncbi:hypothetical protein [Lysobacter sp.]|uniref:hypothetical protein n=1 Tax=Lysobacter sp. TaxID=72226 RepID=UPI002D54EF71|nr:hypothetical protein [Lysobacter sp.]HZX78134.1 hypothetical protein [Lysobacter sp.]
MTQRSNHSQTASNQGKGPVGALRAGADNRISFVLTKLAPITAALILVLVLITGHASAEYGFV